MLLTAFNVLKSDDVGPFLRSSAVLNLFNIELFKIRLLKLANFLWNQSSPSSLFNDLQLSFSFLLRENYQIGCTGNDKEAKG